MKLLNMTGHGTAVSYLRFSSRKQLGNDSYRRQVEATEAYCKANGLTLNTRLEDLAVSGWDKSNLDDTAALGSFLKLVNEGKIPEGTVLICENLDRLTRAGIFDALNLFSNILKAGIDIVTTQDGKRYSYESVKNNVGELIISITYLTRGNNESETKSIRVKESWKRRHAQVKNNEFAKFPCPSWLWHDGKKYQLNEESAKTIQLIFELYVSGFGVYSLVKELNKRKIKPFTKTGKWNSVFLHELLQNSAVIGTYRLVEPPQTNYFPRAISDELFYKAIAQRENNRHFKGRTGARQINIFGGLCKCSCGASMVKHFSKSKKGTEYVGLVCSKAKTGECSYEFTNFTKFQDSFNFLWHNEQFKQFAISKTEAEVVDNTSQIQGKLTTLQKTIARVSDAIVKTDSDKLVERLQELELQNKLLQKELETETIRVRGAVNTSKTYFSLLASFKTHLKDNDFRFSLRNFLRRVIKSIVCSKTGYTVNFVNTPEVIEVKFLPDGNYMTIIEGEENFWRGENGTIYNLDGTKTVFRNDKASAKNKA